MSNPMIPGGLSPGARREGFLLGAVAGSALAARTAGATDAGAVRYLVEGGMLPAAPPAGRRRPATALPDALMEELLSGGVDLHRLAGRWVSWWGEDGFETDERLALALAHLRDFDAPLGPPAVPALAALTAVLPAALTGGDPQAMVRGAFHVAALLDPTEAGALSAAAVAVTAARLLEGHRDFIPDLIAFLRANDAPGHLLDPVRIIPRDPRTPPPVPRLADPDPVAALHWILWSVHHRPRAVPALEGMVLAGGVSPHVGAVLGALLGARDGIADWPSAWVDEAGEEVVLRRGLARQLA